MADCECLSGCPFFNDRMASAPATANLFKKTYCQGDNTNCARHVVFKALGKPNVPGDLFPNQLDRAKNIVSKALGRPNVPGGLSPNQAGQAKRTVHA